MDHLAFALPLICSDLSYSQLATPTHIRGSKEDRYVGEVANVK